MGKKKKMIKNILKNFDFKKVKDVMEYLEWGYFGTDIPPTEDSLIETAKHCLKSSYKQAKENRKPDVTFICATGGFKGSAACNEEGKVDFLQLEFIVADWYVNYENNE